VKYKNSLGDRLIAHNTAWFCSLA